MAVIIDLLETNLFQALRVNYLQSILPNTVEIVRGQGNKVPPPASNDYVVMIPLDRARLGTNVETWDQTNPNPTALNVATSFEVPIQLDLHGPNSADYATLIAALFFSQFACDQFTASGFAIQPLWAEEPRQVPFMDGAQQVEERWIVDVRVQINPNITTTQDFADTLVVGLVNTDTVYPKAGQLDFTDPYQSGLIPGL